jgi:eukaryotic-like serine/threonine-protein kinase
MAEKLSIDASLWDQSAATRTAAQRGLRKDVLEPAVLRIRALSLTAAGGGLVLLGISLFALPPAARLGAVGPLAAALILSVAMFGLTWVRRLDAAATTTLGYAYLLLLCLALGFLRHAGGLAPSEPLQVLYLGVLPILTFAAVVPAVPQKVFFVSLAAALMDPLAFGLTAPKSSPLLLLGLVAMALGVAWVSRQISSAVHKLTEGIRQAQRVGSYRLVRRLGVGGMAEVWRAEHRMLARPAAIKLIRPEVLVQHGPIEAERLLRLFTREARTTAQLSSPHTIVLYDFGINREGSFYFVMELLDGMDLQTLVERFGPQPSERVAHLLFQVCHSLREAHLQNFVHRDVKPANIFTCALGGELDFAKVLDFGLVLDRAPTADEIEDEQRFVGTPSVMAPEMLRFQAPVDARADIYAVGCVGYWLLTGQRVFEATTRADMLVMHAHQKPILPSKRVGLSIAPALEAVIMSCLEKNPNKRPQSAGEVMDLLRALAFPTPWTDERASLWWKTHVTTHIQISDGPAPEKWMEPAG